jgi:hypothetical protein
MRKCTEEGCNGEIGGKSIILPAGCPERIEAVACNKCGALSFRDHSPVTDENENRVFFIREKLYSKNKKGEMEIIKVA